MYLEILEPKSGGMRLLTTKTETKLDSTLALAERLSRAVSISSRKYDGYAR